MSRTPLKPFTQQIGTARCPRCHTITATTSGTTDRAWYCHECRMEFEPDDDGDIGYGRPSKRLEREERRK